MSDKRRYLPFDLKSASGYPTGINLFYECTKCGDVLPSLPKDSLSCSCKNLHIDVDYGRLAVADHSCFKIFLEEDNKNLG